MNSRVARGTLTLLACAVVISLAAAAPASAAGVVKADAGEYFSLAVLSDGTLWGWGYNAQGQLGDGTRDTHLSPSKADTGTAWSDASAGYRHSLAIKSDGSLWSWGWNRDGQLGIGHAENTFTPDHWHDSPARVGSGTSWVQVSAGYDHSLALDLDGGLWSWGGNLGGQLGIGSTDPTATPVRVDGSVLAPGVSWVRIWADRGLSLALSSDGTLWQWGNGVTRPEAVLSSAGFGLAASDDRWLTISPARGHISVTMADSSMWSWVTSETPEPWFFGWEWADVAETIDHVQTPAAEFALMLKSDHSLWIATDKIGLPVPLINVSKENTTAAMVYIVGNALDWTRLSGGTNHFLLTKSDGSLWGWGKNTFGQLGNGSETDVTSRMMVPVRVILPTPIPNVTGMTQSDAQDRIVEKGFKVGTVTLVASTEVEITRIISQTPATNTLVMPGGSVNIVVSAGPPIAVPNVVNMTEDDARAAIGAAGLGVSVVTEAYSATVPGGAVISQTPIAGTPVITGSKVALVVSKGPQPKSVPYVARQTEAAARATLEAQGFVVGSVVKEYSTTVAAGLVTRTSPTAGTMSYVGESIIVYVSLGKPAAAVSNPHAPTTMYVSRRATVYGTLRPRHTAGTYPVRIYKWRKTSTGSWKSYGYVTAMVSNYYTYSKYSRAVSLPYRGSWRLRAYAPEDAAHRGTWSAGYDYVTVR